MVYTGSDARPRLFTCFAQVPIGRDFSKKEKAFGSFSNRQFVVWDILSPYTKMPHLLHASSACVTGHVRATWPCIPASAMLSKSLVRTSSVVHRFDEFNKGSISGHVRDALLENDYAKRHELRREGTSTAPVFSSFTLGMDFTRGFGGA